MKSSRLLYPVLGLLMACADTSSSEPEALSLSELSVLPLASSAPPPSPLSAWIRNDRRTVVVVRHPDQLGTVYAEVAFPAGAFAGLATGDSVRVTLSPAPGRYGLDIDSQDIAFAVRPTVTFDAARYGDFQAGVSPVYPTPEDYFDALEIWRETPVGLWSPLPGGRSDVVATTFTASVSEPGSLLLAARR